MEAVTLRRGWSARLRTIRIYEIVTWLIIVAALYSIRDGVDVSKDLGLLVVACAALAVRLAIATESVRCDETGVTWRCGFVATEVPWDQISSIGIGVTRLRLPVRGMITYVPCLEIDRMDGGRTWRVMPSVWTSMADQADFITAARLISPRDWSLVDVASGGRKPSGRGTRMIEAMQGRGSGKRVGRPIPKRRVGPGQ